MSNFRRLSTVFSLFRFWHEIKHLRRLSAAPLLALLGLCLLLWFLGAIPSQAKPDGTIRYVTGSGTGSACSIALPCSLETAVTNSLDGDEIRVAAGTYTNAGSAVISLTVSISLTGGYDDNNWGTSPNPQLNQTILDGESTRRVIYIAADTSPEIKNFIVENGRASDGAGIYIASGIGSPIIRNNEIRANQTNANPNRGGGIYDGGYALIEYNQIHNNNAGQGGSILVDNGGTSSTQIRINNLYANTAATGAGVFVRAGDTFLEANEFDSNTSDFGAGFYALSSTSNTLYSNLFHHNTASSDDGGAIYTWADDTYWNNTIADNDGGSIYVFGGTIQINNSIIAFNNGGTNDGIVNDSGTVTGGYNNVYSDTNSAGVTLSDPISGDPLFVERVSQPYNYHLISGSPDIDAGDPSTPADVDVDIDEQARPFDGRWDVGADEYGDLIEFTVDPVFTLGYADKGTTATYTHTVRNTGNQPDNYNFVCNNVPGWTVTCPLSITLNPQAATQVNTLVDVPAMSSALDVGTTAIQVISTLSATVSNTAVIDTIVNPSPGLEFTPSYSQTVLPGDIITFTHYLTNTGDSPDIFTVKMLPGSNWGQLIPVDLFQIPLGVGESQLVLVEVTVAPEAPAGLADVTQIQATSSYNMDAFAIVTDTVVAKPTVGTRYVNKDGRDTDNNCTQKENPCLTVGHAVGQASFDDDVYVAVGIYPESDIALNDTIHISGGWTNSFTTQGEPDQTILDAEGITLIFNIAPGSAVFPSISNLTLINGDNGGPGGAVYVGSFAQPGFDNVIFENNHAPRGGAIFASSNALVTIQKGAFSNNSANTDGGAVYTDRSTLVLEQSRFLTNTVPGQGGAVYINGGQTEAVNNLFRGNSGGDGGAIQLTGTGGQVSLLNNTFVENAASSNGGGVYNNGAAVTAVNNIFASNTATTGSAIFQAAGNGSTNLSYSNVWSNDLVNVPSGSGNISADPLFMDDSYRLGRGSPSLDVADPDTTLDVDFEDDPRPADAGFDMGYDELAGCRALRVGINEPFGSIQDAIAADATSNIIRVTGLCRGVFPVDAGSQIISQTVYLTQSMVIQGGWNNDFTKWTSEPTYVDPEGNGRGIYVSGDVAPVIDSLIIINGNATGLGGGPSGEDAGGGVYNLDSSVVLTNVKILTGTAVLGGGFYNHSGNPLIGSYLDEDIHDPVAAPFAAISNNDAFFGGGIYNNMGQLQVDAVRISYNEASNGGGIYNHQGAITVTNAAIYENRVSGNGGGIYNDFTADYWHLTVYSNTANLGGGFYNNNGNSILRSSIFQSNQANSGPAIFVSDGVPDVDYNYYHDQVAPALVNISQGVNDVNDNVTPPGLQDPVGGNFHLLETAVAIDLADPVSPVNHDFDGDLRPTNQAPDVGADELAGCLVQLNDQVFGSIQAALDVAQTGDTLNVSGTCRGVHDYNIGSGNACSNGSGDMAVTVHLDKSVHLVGGWDDKFKEQKDAYITTLDAQQLGRVIYIAPNITPTIEGFHIINGLAANGGGICIDNAAPRIINNEIYSHTSTNGGAVYSLNSTALLDEGNRIYQNQANNGAAVYATGGPATIQNNFVYSNTAVSGGAFYNQTGDNNFWHNTIYANEASGDGGAVYVQDGSPAIHSNIIISNSAVTAGGVYGAGGSPSLDYNDYYSNTNGNVGGSTANLGLNHMTVDPQFKDLPNLDFTIFYTSPIADMGDPTLPITGDYELDIRPSHQGFDIGADEVGGCFARIFSDPDTIYGSVQAAVDTASAGDLVQVDGICYGVNNQDVGGPITQTLFIDKDLTIDGDWDYQDDITATLDALYRGRVLFVTAGSTVTVTNLTLRHGAAASAGLINESGGGICNNGTLILQDSKVAKSSAVSGGGLYNVNNLTVNGTKFTGNISVFGGGIYQADGDLILDGNWFFENEAANGGALYLAQSSNGVLDVWNNFIYDNTATNQGAGVYNSNTDGRVWHNTFVFNNGDGLYSAAGASDNIRSNIFDRNSGVGIRTTAVAPTIDYNNVFSNTAGNYGGTAAAGANDISGLPLYRDQANQDFHLSDASAGADVADPALPMANLDHDIDGDIRPTNGGPDMGADEINSCLIRVNDQIFGVFQLAIDYAESLGGVYPVEMARGACRGVQTVNGTNQVGYIEQDLDIIGSLRRSDFSDPNDYDNPDIGAVSTAIDAQNEGRVLLIANGAHVTFTHVALVQGNAYNANDSNNHGGGIYNAANGSFTTSETQTCANIAENGGGYFGNAGTNAYFSGAGTGDCLVAQFTDKDQHTGYEYYLGNNSVINGAGMYVGSGAVVNITNHGMDDNIAGNDGGVVFNDGQMEIKNGLFYYNFAGGSGGAVYNVGDLSMLHNTVRNNDAVGNGGAVYNGAGTFLHINSTIIYSNTAGSGSAGVHSINGGTSGYNNFFQNTPANVNGFTLDSNSRVGEPGLNFLYLDRHSRNIDAADPAMLLSPYFVTFDANNIPRPDGPVSHNGLHGYGSDVGALEYWKDFGCEVVPNSQGTTVSPGDIVTYTVGIYNVGNPSYFDDPILTNGFTDTFTVTVASQVQGWGVFEGGDTQLFTLDWFDSVSRTLTVTVPSDAEFGLRETTAIQCESGSVPGRKFTGIVQTDVGLVNAILVAPEYITTAYPGDVLTFTHYITNEGNASDDFLLIPNAGADGLSTAAVVRIEEDNGTIITSTTGSILQPITLDVHQAVTAFLRIDVLQTAIANGIARPGLIARSIDDPTVSGEVINQITISPTNGTRHVAIGGVDEGNNCLVADQPCATIQHAVDQALDGDEVWIAAGLYTDFVTRTVGLDVLEQNVFIDKSITIRGGFSVDDSFALAQPITNAVTLDGQGGRRVVYVADGLTVTLQSLFIQNGDAAVIGAVPDYGGGIYNAGANLTVTGSWITSNSGRLGGGLYHADGSLQVNSSVFAFNDNVGQTAPGEGGGVYVAAGVALLENNTFVGNETFTDDNAPNAYGGGIYVSSGTAVVLNNIFQDNQASDGTAVFIAASATVTNDYSLFENEPTPILGGSPGANSIAGTAVFLDNYYHIGVTSDAKDAGTGTVSVVASEDFDLEPRVQGLAIDIGADERTQKATFDLTPITQTATIDSGAIFTYTHRLTNTGDFTNTYTLVMSNEVIPAGGTGWGYDLSPTAIPDLGYGQSVTVTLVITGGQPGYHNRTIITATPAIGAAKQVVDTTIISHTAGVDIEPPRSGNGDAGTDVIYNHTLINSGNGADRYFLRPITATAVPQGWAVSIVPTYTDFVLSGNQIPFSVTVSIPPGTAAGTQHVIAIEGVSASDATVTDTLWVTTTVNATYNLSLTPDNSTTSADNMAVQYNHTLTNLGNITDTITLTGTSNPAWDLEISPLAVTLPAADSINVMVTVTVPADTGGQVHIATIIAESSSPGITATAVNTTTVGELSDVRISPDNNQIMDAGATAIYTHTVTNLGNITDTFALSTNSSLGWLDSVTNDSLILASGESAAVTVTVTAPGGATPGMEDSTIITVTSATDPAVFDSAADVTRVRQQHGLLFTPDNSAWVDEDSQVDYTHYLTNTGNGPDTFAFTTISSQGWSLTTPSPVMLNSGESAMIVVNLTVPVGAGGLVDIMQVTAHSTISSAVSAVVTNTTTVSATLLKAVSLEPNNFMTSVPGDTVTFTHRITNSGDITDSYSLSVSSVWTATVEPTAVSLDSGESAPVTVTVMIPAAATNGEFDTATVTAVSDTDLAVSDSAEDVTIAQIVSTDVALEPDNDGQGVPGDTLVYGHTLTNTGSAAMTFLLTAQSNQGWTVAVTPDRLTNVSVGEARAVSVTVTISDTAVNGDDDITVVVATSLTDPAISDLAIDRTQVAITYGVIVTPDNAMTGTVGAAIPYTHTVTNNGNFTETFALTAVSNQGWATALSPTTLTLGENQSSMVMITVTIPLNATVNMIDVTTVTAATTSPGANVSDSATDTTTVVSAGPMEIYLPIIQKACAATGVDLIVTSIMLDPNPPTGGQATNVYVTIKNQGAVDVTFGNNFFLDFYVDRVPAQLLTGDIAWGVQGSQLTSGASVTFIGQYTFSGGAHQLWAQVDTDNTVDECPKDNNNVLGPIGISAAGTAVDGGQAPPPPSNQIRQTPTPQAVVPQPDGNNDD